MSCRGFRQGVGTFHGGQRHFEQVLCSNRPFFVGVVLGFNIGGAAKRLFGSEPAGEENNLDLVSVL